MTNTLVDVDLDLGKEKWTALWTAMSREVSVRGGRGIPGVMGYQDHLSRQRWGDGRRGNRGGFEDTSESNDSECHRSRCHQNDTWFSMDFHSGKDTVPRSFAWFPASLTDDMTARPGRQLNVKASVQCGQGRRWVKLPTRQMIGDAAGPTTPPLTHKLSSKH